MDLNACLERIHYRGPLDVSYETLKELQHAFLLSVPFENLDIHLGRRIEFTSESVFRKVVEQRRGGFCYELNSLFRDILAEIGFDVHLLAARMIRDGKIGRERGHMVLAVNLNEGWLVDVGNGKSSRAPLRLDGANENQAEDFCYRVSQNEIVPALLEKPEGADWRPRFVFDLTPLERSDFQPSCDWMQTSQDSIFTKNRICTVARSNGRVMLINRVLSTSDETGTKEREVDPGEYGECLRTCFGLEIDPAEFLLNMS